MQQNQKKEEQIIFIQRSFRHYLEMKRLKKIRDQADEIVNNAVKEEDPTQQQMINIHQEQSDLSSKLPYDIWIDVISYIIDIDTIKRLIGLNKFFNQIFKFNIVWKYALSNQFPSIYQKIDDNDSNWKAIFQEKFIRLKSYFIQLKEINKKKELGNEKFRENQYKEAKVLYLDAYQYFQDSQSIIKQDYDLLSKQCKILILKCRIILGSNLSLVEIKLNRYHQAFIYSSEGLRLIKQIRLLLSEEDFEKEYSQLLKKLNQRLKVSVENQPIRFYHYSQNQNQQLRLGSMLTHQGQSFSMFDQSKVLMVEFNRNEAQIGLILNRKVNLRDGRQIHIGGPCELHQISILHNIPNVPGAKLVVQDVYYGGDIEQYRNNPDYKIIEYYGYASWFEGQLDGEVENGGWEINNQITPDQVFDRSDILIQSINQ